MTERYNPLFSKENTEAYEKFKTEAKPVKVSPMSGKPMQQVTVGPYNGPIHIPAYICKEDRVCIPVEDDSKK